MRIHYMQALFFWSLSLAYNKVHLYTYHVKLLEPKNGHGLDLDIKFTKKVFFEGHLFW
jgi:hypothetical protein